MKNIAKAATIYGTGAAEHGNSVAETLGNYAENMGLGAIGGTMGHKVGQQFFGRAHFPPLRNVYEQVTGTAVNSGYKFFKD